MLSTNSIKGPNKWWPVPLGLRICTSQLPGIYQLYRGLAWHDGLADCYGDSHLSLCPSNPRADRAEQSRVCPQRVACHVLHVDNLGNLLSLQHFLLEKASTCGRTDRNSPCVWILRHLGECCALKVLWLTISDVDRYRFGLWQIERLRTMSSSHFKITWDGVTFRSLS